MTVSYSSGVLLALVLLLLARPAHAFGAGNIASISAVEGINWRHGDIEDTLLTLMMARVAGGKKFDKLMVARVYFGNWLRDYSQAIDVGTVKYVSAEAIRILLWVLGFMTFGYGTKEFEVTAERLGCYRPEDHIDNPKDYADNLDAREYDRRLRGPINERIELAIDPRRGLKNYIASEEVGITTSAGHVRKLFMECIRLGRSYGRTRNEAELFEALRLMGTGLHCLEDFSAHSNYVELALIEMGERNVFPHVGSRTQVRLPGVQSSVYPVITGTFGGVDFLHSVMGEFDDKATQSEIQQLEGTMQSGAQGDASVIKELLNQIPSGLFGGGDQAGKADELQENSNAARLQNMHVTPKRPEAVTLQMQEMAKKIYPVLEYHDEIMRSIAKAIESIPVLPELIEQLEDQINIFVFSLLAPFMIPVINQIKVELNQGSSEIIQSSQDKQFIVFHDDHSTDPTHSMLSKDHFSNVLNEPAGKAARETVAWVVPQLMQCWDDEHADPTRTINRIINGVFHHPAQRNMGDDGAAECRRRMFGVVEQWWRSANQQDVREQLSRDGVQRGLNHKPGQHDTGHGCGKPLGMTKHSAGDGSSGILGDLLSALGGGSVASSVGQGYGRPVQTSRSEVSQLASEAVGGGAFGGVFSALAGGIGGGLLGEVLGGGKSETKSYTQQYQTSSETKSYSQQHQTSSEGFIQSYTEVGETQIPYGQPQYGQAQYQQTQFPGGGQHIEYKQYEQQGQYGQTGYAFEERSETRQTYGGGFENLEKTYNTSSGAYESEGWGGGWPARDNSYREDKHHKKDSDSGDEYKKYHKKDDSGSDKESKKHGKDKKDKDKKKHDESDDEGERPQYCSQETAYGRSQQGGFGGGYGGYDGLRGGREYAEPVRQGHGGGGGFSGRAGYGASGGYGTGERKQVEEEEEEEVEVEEEVEEAAEEEEEEVEEAEEEYAEEEEYADGEEENRW